MHKYTGFWKAWKVMHEARSVASVGANSSAVKMQLSDKPEEKNFYFFYFF